MVTAELAACLPVLLLMLAVVLSAVNVAAARVRAQDAAREAVRAAARGDPVAARRLAAQVAPGASISLRTGGEDVTAVAVVRARLVVPFLPAVAVTQTAVAALEPQ
jgi:Flp pilus assembly protein TadG